MTSASADQEPIAASADVPLRLFGPSKLRVRLLFVVLLTGVPVFAVEAYCELQLGEQRRAEISQQVQQMAELVAGQLDRPIEGAQSVLVTSRPVPVGA
jgi:hypothetical protein